jgi:fibro-slime domain-containing protein
MLALAVSFLLLRPEPAPSRALSMSRKMYLIARDFKQSRHLGGHDDFQGASTPPDSALATPLVVEESLGEDGRPVMKSPVMPGFTCRSNFNQWFQNLPGVNQKVPLCLTMRPEPNDTHTLLFENKDFFPLDGEGLNDARFNDRGDMHNYYFTVELHKQFVYLGGENITVGGDDDMWVFINGSLVIDLGGLHTSLSGSAELDDLNLNVGSNATLDIFAAKRRCCGSHFRLETSIRFPRDPCEEETRCCLSETYNFMCLKQKWWTFWCPAGPPPAGKLVETDPAAVAHEDEVLTE